MQHSRGIIDLKKSVLEQDIKASVKHDKIFAL